MTIQLSLKEHYLLNGIPEGLEVQPLYKLQACHSAMIKHAPQRN